MSFHTNRHDILFKTSVDIVLSRFIFSDRRQHYNSECIMVNPRLTNVFFVTRLTMRGVVATHLNFASAKSVKGIHMTSYVTCEPENWDFCEN